MRNGHPDRLPQRNTITFRCDDLMLDRLTELGDSLAPQLSPAQAARWLVDTELARARTDLMIATDDDAAFEAVSG